MKNFRTQVKINKGRYWVLKDETGTGVRSSERRPGG